MKTMHRQSDAFDSDDVFGQHNKMSMTSDKDEKDLERGAQTCFESHEEDEEEEEKIQLLEDRSAGKFVYYFSPYFFGTEWLLDILMGLIGACFGLGAQAFYVISNWLYYHPDKELSDLPSPLWMSLHYFLYFFVFFVNYICNRECVEIETKALQKLLEEVSETDLMGDSIAWRIIAFRVNQCSKEKKCDNSVFYSEKQCRRFFVREVVKPIELGSNNIKNPYVGGRWTSYFNDSSNRSLAERAVGNYKKSLEDVGEFSDMDEENNRKEGLLKMFNGILSDTLFYSMLMELAFYFVMLVVIIALLIFDGIFDRFTSSN